MFRKIVAELSLGAEIASDAAVLAHNESRKVGLSALDVFPIDAVVPDLGIGHRDNLSAIAGIGEDLLVAGHRRIKDDLSVYLAGSAERDAGVDGSIFQCELRSFSHRGVMRAGFPTCRSWDCMSQTDRTRRGGARPSR